jgi:hypothetical protein
LQTFFTYKKAEAYEIYMKEQICAAAAFYGRPGVQQFWRSGPGLENYLKRDSLERESL